MKNRKRLDRVQGDQNSNQELLVLSLQGQRKAIDDALEWRGGEQGSCNQAPVPPTRPPPTRRAQPIRPQFFLRVEGWGEPQLQPKQLPS